MRELGHAHLSRAKVEKVLKEGLGHTSGRNLRELGHAHLSRAKVEKVLKEGLGHTSRRELEGTWSHTPVKSEGREGLEGGTWSHIKEGT